MQSPAVGQSTSIEFNALQNYVLALLGDDVDDTQG